jgi:anti-anti-sigma factor
MGDATKDALAAEGDRLRRRIAELEGTQQELARVVAERDALRASEAEFRAIFNGMTDVVLVMSTEGRYLKIAPTAPDLLYKPSEDLLGKTVHDIMPKEMGDFFVTNFREAASSRRVVPCEYSLDINGREVFFDANVSPMSEDTIVLVARDITEQKRAQKALEESQAQLIRAQAAALVELSTPLIPISDEIVVMPLIGVLDSRRMEHATQILLEGIQRTRAKAAILDITGVSLMDSSVADSLVRAARAVQLLGSRVILTGIRPDVAQTLVTIGAPLSGIVTRGTLQSGIAHAMARDGSIRAPT